MTFGLHALRFQFTALDAIHFAAGRPGNILRGAFGAAFKRVACAPECTDARTCAARATCAYARFFEPAAAGEPGPSGQADWPRPFVFRARHLDGITVEAGAAFHVHVNVFSTREPLPAELERGFAEMGREGLGTGRGRASLDSVSHTRLDLPLTADGSAPQRIRVDFLSPTELKAEGQPAERPDFPTLFGRARDRVVTLRALYGKGPADIDFKGPATRAARVRMTACSVQPVFAERRSARTGQVHTIGGFTGFAEYEGELAEFLPWLRAAAWSGVGRHTVWGNGEIRVQAAGPPTP